MRFFFYIFRCGQELERSVFFSSFILLPLRTHFASWIFFFVCTCLCEYASVYARIIQERICKNTYIIIRESWTESPPTQSLGKKKTSFYFLRPALFCASGRMNEMWWEANEGTEISDGERANVLSDYVFKIISGSKLVFKVFNVVSNVVSGTLGYQTVPGMLYRTSYRTCQWKKNNNLHIHAVL